MKKLFAVVFLLLLVCAGAGSAWAEEGEYATAGELYRAWAEDLPDYICGVWSTDGGENSLTFGIQNTEAGNAGKQEILDRIRDDATAAFVYQTYSRTELLRIQREIDGYFGQDVGLLLTALREQENRVEVAIHEQRREEEATRRMVAELNDKYGDAIRIEYTDQTIALTIGVEPREQPPYALFAAGVLAVCFLLAAGFVVKRRRQPLLQTNAGRVETAPAPLTIREVAERVRRSEPPMPPELDARIMEAIDKTEK